jgi:enoyl-CoA hydratase/carnithine racemase
MAAPRTPLASGTTPGLVALSRDISTGVFVLDLVGEQPNPENRWTLAFTQAIHRAFDAVEDVLAEETGQQKPAALVTISSSPKFFSNGIDVDWVMSPDTDPDALGAWNDLVMPAFARPILLGCPTICAIGGHAFGAGLMFALGHDHRIQRADKGFMCAVEVAIGVPTPPCELTLFRHAMPADAFYSTVLEAKRWGGAEAAARGVVQA